MNDAGLNLTDFMNTSNPHTAVYLDFLCSLSWPFPHCLTSMCHYVQPQECLLIQSHPLLRVHDPSQQKKHTVFYPEITWKHTTGTLTSCKDMKALYWIFRWFLIHLQNDSFSLPAFISSPLQHLSPSIHCICIYTYQRGVCTEIQCKDST